MNTYYLIERIEHYLVQSKAEYRKGTYANWTVYVLEKKGHPHSEDIMLKIDKDSHSLSAYVGDRLVLEGSSDLADNICLSSDNRIYIELKDFGKSLRVYLT